MSKEEQKNTALVPVQKALQPRQEVTYWTRASVAYKIAFRTLLVALPLFAVLFMIICSRAFTYDSVFGFFKDLSSSSSFISSDYQTVSYTYEEGESKALSYRGGVAVVTTGGVEVYSPDGERLLDVAMELNTPRAVSSRKYVLAYDFGGTEFTLTNTYTRLHRGNTEFPIYMADVANSGRFALVTASDEHLSQVLLYDANFNLIQRFGRASATTAVSVSDNGRYAAIAGISSEKGKAKSVIELYRIGATEKVFSVSLEEERVLSLSFTDNRYLVLLTDSYLRVLNTDGDVKAELSLSSAQPIAIEINEYGCMLALQSDAFAAENRILVLDKKGEILYDAVHAGDLVDISFAEEYAFLLFDAQVMRIEIEKGDSSQVACAPGAMGILAADGKHLRIIYRGEAIYLDYEEL